MTEMPEIIIRTPEERETEKSFPWWLTEGRLASGTAVMIVGEEKPCLGDDYIEFRTWRFKTEESCLVFAAAMIRDMRKDGAADIRAPYTKIWNAYPDRRLSWDSYENPPLRCVPLEW